MVLLPRYELGPSFKLRQALSRFAQHALDLVQKPLVRRAAAQPLIAFDLGTKPGGELLGLHIPPTKQLWLPLHFRVADAQAARLARLLGRATQSGEALMPVIGAHTATERPAKHPRSLAQMPHPMGAATIGGEPLGILGLCFCRSLTDAAQSARHE
jgi:hypothetical protein